MISPLLRTQNLQIIDCLKSKTLLNSNSTCEHKGKARSITSEINLVLSDSTTGYQNVFFIDPSLAICTEGTCTYNIDDKSIFMTDGEHLSGYGSEIFWNYIIDHIEH